MTRRAVVNGGKYGRDRVIVSFKWCGVGERKREKKRKTTTENQRSVTRRAIVDKGGAVGGDRWCGVVLVA